jgi:hypothetical protein
MSLLKKKEEKIIPVAVDTSRWIADNFDEGDFPNSNTVYVAFRTVGSMKREHWLNRMAADMTKKKGAQFPSGRMCHAEIIIPISESRYVKASVIKKSYDGVDDKGKIKWKKGCVHCKLTTPSEWKNKYVFVTLHATREMIKKALRFYLANNGQDFNHVGYYANLIVPGGIGVHAFDETLMKNPRSFFCTEFIVTGLQALASVDDSDEHDENDWQTQVKSMNPATSNPNDLFDRLNGSKNVYGTSPLGKVINVEV